MLRTSRGYRKPSHGFKHAVVEATTHQHLRSVSTVLAGQALMTGDGPVSSQQVKSSARNPDQYMLGERYSYLHRGKSVLSGQMLLSICVDGVHVGDEDWLNVLAWSPATRDGFVCPPQACLSTKNPPTSPLPIWRPFLKMRTTLLWTVIFPLTS